MWIRLLMVALGGATGALARYGVGLSCQALFGPRFPVATLFVNLVGCFVIGILSPLILEMDRPELRALLIIGFLGSLTTFSTFAWEAREMLHEGQFARFLGYVLLSNVLGILGVAGGFVLAHKLGAEGI